MKTRRSNYEKLVSVSDIAYIFDCKPKSSVRKLIEVAKLKRVQQGYGKYKYRFSDVQKLVDSGFDFKPAPSGMKVGTKFKRKQKRGRKPQPIPKKAPLFDPKFTDRKGAMEMLGYRSRTAVRQLEKNGVLKNFSRFGHLAKYKIADIERIIEERG